MQTITHEAYEILESRYLQQDRNGRVIESPEQMFERVANHIAGAEQQWGGHEKRKLWERRFLETLCDLDFLPNSPTLMNAGLPAGQLSACFVLPIEDSLHGIFSTLKHAALIHQSGGGTGFNFSSIRPRGSLVNSKTGVSSGPVRFMQMFNEATEVVRQGGKRRGANMAVLDVDHPDIVDFVHAKTQDEKLRNFNISVGVTDRFMEAVLAKKKWVLSHPALSTNGRTIDAEKLWHMIVTQAWQTGDPGLLFVDTINLFNPTPALGTIRATNPCGELPLLDYESCNLGSINLSHMVKKINEKHSVDWYKLGSTIEVAVRFLDNVIEVNTYPLPEICSITKANRKIGLGVMGWAEMLILLGIPYASEEGVELAGKLMQFITEKSGEVSRELARERGEFPNFNRSIHTGKSPLRNAASTSIAPTGSIATIAGTSFSIEPLFALAYTRSGILEGRSLSAMNALFVDRMKEEGCWSNKLGVHIKENGTLSDWPDHLPERNRQLFQTALEIPWSYHLRHQLAFQQHTDNAVSKTINLHEGASVDDVSEIYFTAWKGGAKGITIYRWGSKTDQVFHRGCSIEKC